MYAPIQTITIIAVASAAGSIADCAPSSTSSTSSTEASLVCFRRFVAITLEDRHLDRSFDFVVSVFYLTTLLFCLVSV